MANPPAASLEPLVHRVRFGGSPEHKLNPAAFGLSPRTVIWDNSLCDCDAGFTPEMVQYVVSWMQRALLAGLVGELWEQGAPRYIWVVADDGWIYTARLTNAVQLEYHGYPELPGAPIAAPVYHRFKTWVESGHNKARHAAAMSRCAARYRLPR